VTRDSRKKKELDSPVNPPVKPEEGNDKREKGMTFPPFCHAGLSSIVLKEGFPTSGNDKRGIGNDKRGIGE
jgi:hypothetical protein